MTDTPQDLAGKKILVIEDDAFLRPLLVRKMGGLEERGVKIDSAVDGEDGLKKTREMHPDLIMLDLLLPKMNGFEFLEKIRGESGLEKTPVMILSNLSDDADRERARLLGVSAYLVKADFSIKDISAGLEAFLRGKGLQIAAPEALKVEWSSNNYIVHL